MKHISPLREIWIGLAEVVAGPQCKILALGDGAFTNVLMYAETKDDFEQKALAMFGSYGATVLQIDEIEPLRSRLETATVDDELLTIAGELEPEHIRFGALHTFPFRSQ